MNKDYRLIDGLSDGKARYIKSSELAPFLDNSQFYTRHRNLFYDLIRVFVVSRPVEHGGSPLVVCWSKKRAEKIVEALNHSRKRLSEEQFREHWGMPKDAKLTIWVTTLDELAAIPLKEEEWDQQMGS